MKGVFGSALTLVIVVGIVFLAQKSDAQDGGFELLNFPYYRQETEWYCGVASLQMVYEYMAGKSISQDFFASVARTSEAVGTLSNDVVRAMRFSRLSDPANRNVSVSWLGSGYPGYDTGFSADGYDGKEPWISILQDTVRRGLPVIVLQQYWFDDPGGHYRVVYGFNSTHVFMKDPWDRENQPRDLRLTYESFNTLWRYVESPEKGPRYFGASAVPWPIHTLPSTSPTTGKSQILAFYYKYITPIASENVTDALTAEKLFLELQFDSNVWSSPQNSVTLPGPFNTHDLAVNEFQITCITEPNACLHSPPLLRVSGLVSGSVPRTVRDESTFFPSYEYMDFIGSEWTDRKSVV